MWCLIQEFAGGHKVNAQGLMSANDTGVIPRGFRHPHGDRGQCRQGKDVGCSAERNIRVFCSSVTSKMNRYGKV